MHTPEEGGRRIYMQFSSPRKRRGDLHAAKGGSTGPTCSERRSYMWYMRRKKEHAAKRGSTENLHEGKGGARCSESSTLLT